jgi:carbon monoxide dehydrogenase subunit G
MAHYRGTVRSPWSDVRAYEFMVDLEHFADWDPGVTGARRVGGDRSGLGATYDVAVKSTFGGRTLHYVTTVADPPRRVEVRAETAVLVSLDIITIEPDGDGCLVTYDADLSLKGISRLGEPFVALAFRRIGDRAAAGLCAALEGVAIR